MKTKRIKIRGLTRYEEAEVDLEALGRGVVAIAGPNGAGKTTLLEAPFAALHLELPSRPGNLAAWCNGKNAGVEIDLQDGAATYTARVAVDAVAGKTEAYLLQDGKPLTTGKVREYGAEVEARFGSPRLHLAASLAAQNHKGAFLNLDKKDRKDLLAEVLDTEGAQALAEAARDRGKAATQALTQARANLSAMAAERARLAGGPDPVDLRADLKAAEAELARYETDLEMARAMYQDARDRLAAAEAEANAARAKAAETEVVRRRLETVRDKIGDLAATRTEVVARISRQIEARRAVAGTLAEAQAAAAGLEAARDRRAELQGRLREAEAAMRDAAAGAQEGIEARANATAARRDLEAARKKAALLDSVPCHGDFPTCGFLRDAVEARGQIQDLEATMKALEVAADKGRAASEEVEEIAKALVLPLKDQIAAATAEIERLTSAAAGVEPALRARAELPGLEAEAIRAEAEADTREAELKTQAADLEAALAAAEAVRVPDLAPLKAEVNRHADAGRSVKVAVDSAHSKIRGLSAALATAEAAAARAQELQTEIEAQAAREAALAQEAGEWATLEKALGRDGIQALEIDAAGPTLSGLANDLLRETFGPRFEVSFVTQVPKADGKGQKEVFDLIVMDHDRGREGAVEGLSGGEKVVISEAVSLALAIYSGRTSGRRFETLWRDETAGQLDPENARRYVRMLRAALEIGNFFQIVFIAQQKDVWEAADSVVWTDGGKVEVLA